jgi:uncharacterized protein YbjT (DUF2867 family)
MTVMVTGASGPVGRALVPLLARNDEVRAVIRRPDEAEPLRRLGAKVAIGRLDDVDELTEVLRGVFTVIHLVGGPNQSDPVALWDANHGSVLRAIAAAKEAGVRRLVLVSVPGASPASDDPYLRARGLAEEAVTTSGLDHAVIRSTHVIGAGSLWFTSVVTGAASSPPIVVGDGSQAIAPVAVEDLAAVLAAADDRQGILAGTWALEGPDVVTADDLVGLLAGSEAPSPRHVEGPIAQAALEDLLGVQVSRETVGRFSATCRSDATPARPAFDAPRTTIAESVRATLAAVADADAGGAR